MTVTCPRGHESTSDDYCDECGARIGPPQPAERLAVPASSPASPPSPDVAALPSETCPRCSTSRPGDDRYCETCGYDFVERPELTVPASGVWRATITVDREYHERLAPPVELPAGASPWSMELSGDEVTIGRSSRSQHIEPDIDLGAPIEDPGVSHRHASFVRTADDEWSLVDHGSTNGTAMNGTKDLVTPGAAIRLADGDRIHLGAWTTIVLEHISPEEPTT